MNTRQTVQKKDANKDTKVTDLRSHDDMALTNSPPSDNFQYLQNVVGNQNVRNILHNNTSTRIPTEPDNSEDNFNDMQIHMDPGRPLDSQTRLRMEGAFGTNFNNVRIHTDATAVGLSRRLQAHAFTVGNDIAFNQKRYRPGTAIGDALLAHELAHVVQQRGSEQSQLSENTTDQNSDSQLEADASSSSLSVLSRLWGKAADFGTNLADNAMPRFRSGLRLQRCFIIDALFEEEDLEEAAPATEPAPTQQQSAPTPPRDTEADRDAVEAHLNSILADNELNPSDWASLRQQATAHGIDQSDLSSIISFDLNFERPYDEVIAILALNDNPVIRSFVSSYTTQISGDPPTLSVNPLNLLVERILSDNSIELDEFNALKEFQWVFDTDAIRSLIEASNIGEPTRSGILMFIEFGYSNLEGLRSSTGIFPINLQATESGELQTTQDLRQGAIQALTSDGTWHHTDFRYIREILKNMRQADAASYMQTAGFEPNSASIIAREFTRSEDNYDYWVNSREGLDLQFQQVNGTWALTTASQQNLALPWHPTVIQPLAPQGPNATERINPTQSTTIESFSFASGTTGRADQLTYQYQHHSFTLILAEQMYDDETLFDRVETALSVIPGDHLLLLHRLVLDPSSPPRSVTADANVDGRVNMYFRGAGPRVPQDQLNETTAHEFGHLVSYHADETMDRFWDQWEQAMADDNIGISRYGFTNEREDFAETYVLYLSGGRSHRETRQHYNHRFGILDTIFSS